MLRPELHSSTEGRSGAGLRALELLLALVLAWSVLRTLRLSAGKYFSIDEFQYAHASWLVAKGKVPSVDFFEFHTPLLYQLGSTVFRVVGDDPTGIRFVRSLVELFLLLGAAWASLLARPAGRVAALLAPILLLCLPELVERSVEIRPDSVLLDVDGASVAVDVGVLRENAGGERERMIP